MQGLHRCWSGNRRQNGFCRKRRNECAGCNLNKAKRISNMGLFDSLKKAAAKTQIGATASQSKPLNSVKLNQDARDSAIYETAKVEIEKRLLFIDEQGVRFKPLADELMRIEPSWACYTAGTVERANELLKTQGFAALVLEVEQALKPAFATLLQPQTTSQIRIVLYDASNSSLLARTRDLAVQPLPITTDAANLAEHIKRQERVQSWMMDAGMKKLLMQCRKLPVTSKLYSEVSEELNSPNGSIELVAQKVAKDPVMTAKFLQVVNSACFALGRQVSDPSEAVMFLGMGRTRALILAAGIFSQFENSGGSGISPEQVWNHSLQVATLAQVIALEETGSGKIGEAAFTSGLVHDLGKLILAANLPAMCAAVEQLQQRKAIPARDAEQQVLGTTHAELAACLLGTWALPLPVLEAVAWHDCPSRSADKKFSPLTAVHAANVFASELSARAEQVPERFDHDYLLRINAGDRRNVWREACGLPIKQEEDAEFKRVRIRHEAKAN